MTGHVGTALYVAPELCSSGRVVYNQKVDIYSLGIIFFSLWNNIAFITFIGIILFEMCYKPLNTSMERIKILSGLRTKETSFPNDFKEIANEKQEFVIRFVN